MQRYEITGMSCAACASHVEKAVAAVPGVQSVAVSLLTNSMQVEPAPDADAETLQRRICRAVEAAGYGAEPVDDTMDAALDDTETPRLKKRLVYSLCFLVPLMYLSMGHMIGLPLPAYLTGHDSGALVYGLLQLALTLPVCWINRAFFISGWKGLRKQSPRHGYAGIPGRRGGAGVRRVRPYHDRRRVGPATKPWSCSTVTTCILSRRP